MYLVLAAVAFVLLYPSAAGAQLATQPANKHSTLIDKNGSSIADATFAKWIAELLLPGGKSDVRDAKFLFQECFGGGMLDDLKSVFGTKVKWVGGSASTHAEPAWGQVSTQEARVGKFTKKAWIADPPENFWTMALRKELAKDQTLDSAIVAANLNDGANKVGDGFLETGQAWFANGGGTIKLRDPGARSHHAVLWGGCANRMRHFTNIKNIRAALVAAWGDPKTHANITIDVLFGDGIKNSKGDMLPAAWNAVAATRAGLKQTLQNLAAKVDPNEQFLFYASDHGGVITGTLPVPLTVPAKATRFGNFLVGPGELGGIGDQLDNVPRLRCTYRGVTQSKAVSCELNQVPLGFFPANATRVTFDVPEPILRPTNRITFHNGGTTTVTIDAADFDTGAIDTNPARKWLLPDQSIVTVDLTGPDEMQRVDWSTLLASPLDVPAAIKADEPIGICMVDLSLRSVPPVFGYLGTAKSNLWCITLAGDQVSGTKLNTTATGGGPISQVVPVGPRLFFATPGLLESVPIQGGPVRLDLDIIAAGATAPARAVAAIGSDVFVATFDASTSASRRGEILVYDSLTRKGSLLMKLPRGKRQLGQSFFRNTGIVNMQATPQGLLGLAGLSGDLLLVDPRTKTVVRHEFTGFRTSSTSNLSNTTYSFSGADPAGREWVTGTQGFVERWVDGHSAERILAVGPAGSAVKGIWHRPGPGLDPTTGHGCAGNGGFTLTGVDAGAPAAGNGAFQVRAYSGTGGDLAVLMLGFAPPLPAFDLGPLGITPPFPGMPRCLLRTRVDVLLPATLAGTGPGAGRAVVPLPIPAAAAGAKLWLQWIELQRRRTNPAGIVVSNGRRAEVKRP